MIKIQIENNKIVVPKTDRIPFIPDTPLKKESIEKCRLFASEMAYGNGHHKSQSFGSSDYDRTPSEIFLNTFQGKIAELAVYNQLLPLEIKPDKPPEFEIWGKGKWEDCDFTLHNGNRRCSVKSTKSFGNLLLLEKEKYNEQGEYLETSENTVPQFYDYTFFVRISGISLESDFDSDKVEVQVVGFMDHSQFLEVIREKQIIKKGTILGTPLLVDNYYLLAKDLTAIKNLKF